MKFEYYKRLLGSYFYYSKPLKNTDYLKNLSKEKTLVSKGLNQDEYFSPFECASEFLVHTIRTNYTTNKAEAIHILDIYKKALADGITEAANNLGIIYHNLDRKDLCELYFKIAVQGGSYFASLNLETLYYDQERYEEFKNTNRLNCSYNNPISIYNCALVYHFGLFQTPDIEKAIHLYIKILDLNESEIKYDVVPNEEDKSILYTIQKRAANNLAILYTENKLNAETIINYPLLRWQLEFMKHVNSTSSIESLYEPTLELEFSVLMSLCLTQNDFTYLDEMLESDAILIQQDRENIPGKKAIIEYFRDWLKKGQELNANLLYKQKYFKEHKTWVLLITSPKYVPALLIPEFHHNKINKISFIRKIHQYIK